MFLFAGPGYGVGPSSWGIAPGQLAPSDALPSCGAAFAWGGRDRGDRRAMTWARPRAFRRLADHFGVAMGKRQTRSAAWDKPRGNTKHLLDAMPIAYAVIYILARWARRSLQRMGPAVGHRSGGGICKAMNRSLARGGARTDAAVVRIRGAGLFSRPESPFIGMTIGDIEAGTQTGYRAFVERIRRGGAVIEWIWPR